MQNAVEWFGYAASVVVAVSLLMSSLIKLRWINLTGALMFSAYGLLIRAYPVAALNFAIALINVWHLARTYRRRDQFRLVPAAAESALLAEFLRAHAAGIRCFFPDFAAPATPPEVAFFALRNSHVAGVILGRRPSPDTLLLELDYVLPEYRDFKVGRFVFGENAAVFRGLGVARLASAPHSPAHRAYLERMGFTTDPTGTSGLLVRPV